MAGTMLAPRVTPSISQDHHHTGWFQAKPGEVSYSHIMTETWWQGSYSYHQTCKCSKNEQLSKIVWVSRQRPEAISDQGRLGLEDKILLAVGGVVEPNAWNVTDHHVSSSLSPPHLWCRPRADPWVVWGWGPPGGHSWWSALGTCQWVSPAPWSLVVTTHLRCWSRSWPRDWGRAPGRSPGWWGWPRWCRGTAPPYTATPLWSEGQRLVIETSGHNEETYP